MKGIADTGLVVAFAGRVACARRNDLHHNWAVNLAPGLTEPLLTGEAVLAESAFHLESRGAVTCCYSSLESMNMRSCALLEASDGAKHIF
jgi:hypothetical protein